MKAVIYKEYGPPEVLHLAEVERPIPGDDGVLVRVHAASLNAYDWRLLRGEPFVARLHAGLRRPRNTILEADIAGRVEAVGRNVKQFRPGDEVFGDNAACGAGGFAEFACSREDFSRRCSWGRGCRSSADGSWGA